MTEPLPLPPEQVIRLSELARACKAAARAVMLYPPAHPAIAATLARLAEQTSATTLPRSLRLTVLPEMLLLDGRTPGRPDQAIAELASLLHEHRIGEMTIHPGGDAGGWRRFLVLLARAPEAVQRDGGVAASWTAIGGRHVELREIDYAEVLRDRTAGQEAAWNLVVASCLEAEAFDLSPDALRALTEIAGDPQRLTELIAALDYRASVSGGVLARTAALVRLLRGIVEAVASTAHENLEIVLRNMASAIGQIAPEVMLELVLQEFDDRHDDASPRIVNEVIHRMTDQTIAQFVTRSVVAANGSSTERLPQAFHVLVPDAERRSHIVDLAHDVAAASPLGQTEEFETLWSHVAELLSSYSDAPDGSERYVPELSGARAQVLEVDRISDDPPERIAAWLGTVSASAVRSLDLVLLLDLLRIEDDPARWRALMTPVTSHVEDLLLVGDFEAADELVAAVVRETGPSGTPGREPAARAVLERLARGAIMGHIVSHLATIDDAQFLHVKSLCLAIGASLVRPLAEMLSTEERGRARERLSALLIAFGASGRETVERLKNSPNAAVRRTAVFLLREFGGNAALHDLTVLLDDAEPQVQREALRAILSIGTDAAYRVLLHALVTATPQSRHAIMQTIRLARGELATPLLAHILGHIDHRGPLRSVYIDAIESLGALRDPEALPSLKTALYRGEWWAPRRSAALRSAAAAALARIGTPAAIEILREAAASGPRQLRAIAGRACAGPDIAKGLTSTPP